MRLMIDAFNLLHAWAGHPAAAAFSPAGGLEQELRALVRLIRVGRRRSARITIVCDGGRPPGLSGGGELADAEVIFAGHGSDADTQIEFLIAGDSAPRRLVVVSSDRRVQAAARRRRGRAMTSQAFLDELARDAEQAGVAEHGPAVEADDATPGGASAPRSRPPRRPTGPHPPAAADGADEVGAWERVFGITDEWRAIAAARDDAPKPTSDADEPDAPDNAASDDATAQDGSADPDADADADDAAERERIAREARRLGAAIDPDELDTGRWLGE